MRSEIQVLLVIPCYRESGRIGPFLQSLREAFVQDETVSVLVVEDGGGEEEQARLRAIVDGHRPQWPGLRPMLALPQNRGKGGAVYAGWETRGNEELLAFVDADGSCAAYEVKELIRQARTKPQTAFFASRVCMLGKKIRRDFHRHLVGRIYATIVSEMLGILVYDSQCGLKVVPAAVFERLRPSLTVSGFAFDVELLCALLDSGCDIREVPIDWHETAGGKVHLFRDSMRMFRDVLDIRRRRQTPEWRAAIQVNQG